MFLAADPRWLRAGTFWGQSGADAHVVTWWAFSGWSTGRASDEAGWDRRPFPRAYNVISKQMCKMWGACQLTESHGWTFSVWREQAQWLSLCRAVLCGHMESTLWSMPIAMQNYLVNTGNAILFSIVRAVSTAILLRRYFYMNIWHQNSFWGECWLHWKKTIWWILGMGGEMSPLHLCEKSHPDYKCLMWDKGIIPLREMPKGRKEREGK